MIVQYSKISDLDASAKSRLFSILQTTVLEGRTHLEFEGKIFSVSDLAVQKRILENQSGKRQALFG